MHRLLLLCLGVLVLPGVTLALTLDEGLKIVAEMGRDVKIARAYEDAAQGGVRLSRSALLPRIDAYVNQTWLRHQPQARISFTGSTVTAANANKDFLSYGVIATQILYDFGKTSSREQIVDAVRLDVKNAHQDLQSFAQRIDVMKTSVGQAEENLRLQRLRYQEGVGTAIEVLDAVTLLSTAQTDWWRAQYDFERAEAGLLYAMGKELRRMYKS